MVGYIVQIETRAPPEYLADWWTDYRSDDTSLTDDVRERSVEPGPDGSVRVVTELAFGRTPVRIEGRVDRVGPLRWNLEGSIHVRGRRFGRERVWFEVEPRGSGSLLTARFRFDGRSPFHRLLLLQVNRRSRRDREASYRVYARAVDRDWSSGRPARAPA